MDRAFDRDSVASELQPLLVELTDLALTAKQAHWNIRGPAFRSIHAQLDDLTGDVRRWSDDVAERLAAIGVPPDGRAVTVAKLTPFPTFPAGFVEDAKVVAMIVERLNEVIERTAPRIDRLDAFDLVSQDVLLGITARLVKHRWMFAAQQS